MFVLKAGGAGLTSLQQSGRIKSGDVLNIKVIRNLEGSSWQISIKGKLLAVTSAVGLKPGSNYQARALFSSGQLLLKIIDQNPLDRLAGDSALPKDDLTLAILKSFVRSSIPYSPEKAAFIYAFCRSVRSEDKALIRLLTLFLDKGIPLNRELLQDAVLLVHGRSEEEGSSKKERESGGREERKKKPIKEALKSTIEGDKGGKENLLQLFNHLKSSHDNWLVFPFDMGTDRGDLTGCIRCRLRSGAAGMGGESPLLRKFSSIVIEVSDEDEPMFFRIGENPDRSAGLSILSNSRKNRDFHADVFNMFKEKLRNIGVSLDENIVKTGTFDGFDFEGPYTPVNAVV